MTVGPFSYLTPPGPIPNYPPFSAARIASTIGSNRRLALTPLDAVDLLMLALTMDKRCHN